MVSSHDVISANHAGYSCMLNELPFQRGHVCWQRCANAQKTELP